MKYQLLSVSSDSKTIKGEKHGYLTAVLYLAPHTLAGGPTICPFSSEGCRRVCLYTAGRGAFNIVQQARIRKTQEFQKNPEEFVWRLHEDIISLSDEAKRKHMVPVVRLNGTSDVMWNKYGIMQSFQDIQFYGYTKRPPLAYQYVAPNEHITYSFSEVPKAREWSEQWYKHGINSAVVFYPPLPKTFLDRPVIDGDESDLRFLDPPGVIVGLKVKGKARKDTGNGFVQT